MKRMEIKQNKKVNKETGRLFPNKTKTKNKTTMKMNSNYSSFFKI
jgi:hypothetical protein